MKCENCGADLNEWGIGRIQKVEVIEYPDGTMSEPYYRDTEDFYCPKCGKNLAWDEASAEIDKWNGGDDE